MYGLMLCMALCYVWPYAMYGFMLCMALCYVWPYAMYGCLDLDWTIIISINYELGCPIDLNIVPCFGWHYHQVGIEVNMISY